MGTCYGVKATPGDRSGTGLKDLEEDPKAFGIKFEVWREAAQKVSRWFRWVEEGAEVFMRKWHQG